MLIRVRLPSGQLIRIAIPAGNMLFSELKNIVTIGHSCILYMNISQIYFPGFLTNRGRPIGFILAMSEQRIVAGYDDAISTRY
jgi:hypothetical protein